MKFEELALERAIVAELTKAQNNGHPDGMTYTELARALGQSHEKRVKKIAQGSPRLQVTTPTEHRGRRLVSLVPMAQAPTMADAMAQAWPRKKPLQRVVYRLRYQWPARDEDGEPITDAKGETEWGAEVVRYYWTRAGLEGKLSRLLDPPADYGAPGRVLSIEVAHVSQFRGVKA